MYLVTVGRGGASGNFIVSLILQFLFNVDAEVDSTHAHAHALYFLYNKTFTNFLELKLCDQKINMVNFNTGIKHFKIQIPLVMLLMEQVIDHRALAELYPKFKHICITIQESDLVRIESNHYFKVAAPGYWELYKKEIFPGVRPGLDDISQLTSNEIKILIDYHIKLSPDSKILRNIDYVQPEYRDSVYEIKFNDILNNKSTVLELLSTITKKNITNNILDFYDRYVEIQHKFAKTNMPWL